MAESYTVQQGNTRSGIASELGVSLDAVGMGRSGDGDLIFPGEQLTITRPDSTGGAPSQPTTTPQAPNEDVAFNMINNQQNVDANSFNEDGTPPTRNAFADFEGQVQQFTDMVGIDPSDAPDAPNFSDMFAELRGDQGITDLENGVNELTRQGNLLQEEKRLSLDKERYDKPVAMNVIEGRMGEQERNYNARINQINIEKGFMVSELDTRYKMIDTVMNLAEMDYKNARDSYDSTFKQKISMIEATQGFVDNQTDNARANAEIIMDQMSNRGILFQDASIETQSMLTKLGVQAGFGPSFYQEMLSQPSSADILTTVQSGDGSGLNVVYKDGTSKFFAFSRNANKPSSGSGSSVNNLTSTQKTALRGSGFNNSDIANINTNINNGATPQEIIEAFGDSLSSEQIKAFNDTMKIKNTQSLDDQITAGVNALYQITTNKGSIKDQMEARIEKELGFVDKSIKKKIKDAVNKL